VRLAKTLRFSHPGARVPARLKQLVLHYPLTEAGMKKAAEAAFSASNRYQ
jgi:hypothetical protein